MIEAASLFSGVPGTPRSCSDSQENHSLWYAMVDVRIARIMADRLIAQVFRRCELLPARDLQCGQA